MSVAMAIRSKWFQLKKWLALLFMFRRYNRLKNFDSYNDSPKRVLFMAAAGLGDVIMIAPALQAMKEEYPEAHITGLMYYNRGGGKLSELIASVDDSVDIGLAKYRFGSIVFMLTMFWKLLFQLRKQKYDIVICFMPTMTRRLLVAGIASKYWVYGNSIAEYPGKIALDIMKLFGVNDLPKQETFNVPVPDRAEDLLPKSLPRPFIGVHPYCGYDWKEWDKFDQLQEMLCQLDGTVITVGKKNGSSQIAPTHNLVNKLSLSELFWVIKQCDVFVTVDSGPMHMAFALAVPTAAMFGFRTPDLLTPEQGMEKHRILYYPTTQSEQACKPPHGTMALGNLQKISVEEVLKNILDLLKKKVDC